MMTPAKLEALRLLAVEPRYTWKRTCGDLIGGRVAKCLARDGLARATHATAYPSIPRYEITDAGRDALRAALQ